MLILQAPIKGKMRRLFSYVIGKEKKQADCSFEERRRMLILQAPIKGKMRRLFSLPIHSVVMEEPYQCLHEVIITPYNRLVYAQIQLIRIYSRF